MLLDYFRYLDLCRFEQRPDYAYLRELFDSVIRETKDSPNSAFCWVTHKKNLLVLKAKKEAKERRLAQLKRVRVSNSLDEERMLAALQQY